MNVKYTYILLISFVFLCSGTSAPAQQKGSQLKLKTVVIDPGHGGKDAGCVSKDRKTYEKNLTLSISKLFGQKIKEAYPDVKVIYTRTTDKYITLNERADIANRNKADLFVSIHINSVQQTSPSGFSVHILGQSSSKNKDLFASNMDVCRRENSVILLEEDYSTKYQGFDPNDPESFIFFTLMQNAFYEQSLLFAADVNSQMAKGPIRNNRGISQDPFYVLWKTTMPSVLVEAGFISNAADLKVLNSATGKEQIAQKLFLAFKDFKQSYDGSINYTADTSSRSVSESSSDATKQTGEICPDTGTSYGIQVLLLSRRLPEGDKALKGYKAEIYPAGKMYKHIICRQTSLEKAKEMHNEAKKSFPDCFVVKIQDGNVTRL